ncbi:MAG: efflux RND transporter periplasmic adaptor subunit [Marinagarivorans sp.]|nr:efflux RND transporter periplasmic adaptor subunit [Marinagarivorans sp.]
MAKKMVVSVFGLLLLIALLAVIKGMQFGAMATAGASMQPPPETVSSSVVARAQWEQTLRSVGTLEAVRGVTITADYAGRIDEVLFVSGATVEKGALLLQQNTDSEQAQLRAAEASMALSKANLTRAKELLAKKVVAQSQYDAADSEYKAAVAQYENIQVTINKKSVKAPFAGRLGIRKVNLGQDIQQGEAIVTLQTSDSMMVNFNLPQKNLAVLAAGFSVRVSTDAVPGHIYQGKIAAINPEVEVRSRSVLVQAELLNDNNRLLPGMFVSVEVVLPKPRDVLMIPATAVSYATYGDSVFVLTEIANEAGTKVLTATQQFIQTGESRGDFVEVLKGVNADDVVASSGLFKLRNGSPVAVNNSVVPEFELNPQPADR